MANVVSSILTSLDFTMLWGQITKILPIVIPVLLFAFGYKYIKHYINVRAAWGFPPTHVSRRERNALYKKYHATVYRNGKVIKRY